MVTGVALLLLRPLLICRTVRCRFCLRVVVRRCFRPATPIPTTALLHRMRMAVDAAPRPPLRTATAGPHRRRTAMATRHNRRRHRPASDKVCSCAQAQRRWLGRVAHVCLVCSDPRSLRSYSDLDAAPEGEVEIDYGFGTPGASASAAAPAPSDTASANGASAPNN